MNGRRPADPGDFGCGPYYTTSHARARCHGSRVISRTITFTNPLVLTAEEAYGIGDDCGTIHGTHAERTAAALFISQSVIAMGFDGIVVRHASGEIEAVNLQEFLDDEAKVAA